MGTAAASRVLDRVLVPSFFPDFLFEATTTAATVQPVPAEKIKGVVITSFAGWGHWA
jgi:hypothetical protein